MNIVKWQPKVQEILMSDVDPQLAASTIEAIVEFWPLLDRVGTLAGVCRAALIYSLSKTPTLTEDGKVVAKWELTKIDPDRPLASNWFEFCLNHLAMLPDQANAYARLWEIYAVGLGRDFDDLIRAGMFRLRAACGTVARQLKEGVYDLALIRALFGDENVCVTCGYERIQETTLCPQCGEEPWQGVGSAPRAELLILLKQINQLAGSSTGARLTLDISRTEIEGHLSIAPILEMGGLTSFLTRWAIEIVEDDAPEDAIGVRESHIDELLQRLWRLAR